MVGENTISWQEEVDKIQNKMDKIDKAACKSQEAMDKTKDELEKMWKPLEKLQTRSLVQDKLREGKERKEKEREDKEREEKETIGKETEKRRNVWSTGLYCEYYAHISSSVPPVLPPLVFFLNNQQFLSNQNQVL